MGVSLSLAEEEEGRQQGAVQPASTAAIVTAPSLSVVELRESAASEVERSQVNDVHRPAETSSSRITESSGQKRDTTPATTKQDDDQKVKCSSMTSSTAGSLSVTADSAPSSQQPNPAKPQSAAGKFWGLLYHHLTYTK